jgi:hypothetical protein
MAKRRKKASTVPAEAFANIAKKKMTFGADASTAIFDVIQTGMSVALASASYKWVILGATFGPAAASDIPMIEVDGYLVAQLLTGERDAMVDDSDATCISSVQLSNSLIGAAGGGFMKWPLVFPILSPYPVFSNQITVGMKAGNLADFNLKDWVYRIVYVPAGMASEREAPELLAVQGQL